LGPKALGDYYGLHTNGLFLGISMTTGGAAWIHKKYIEEGTSAAKAVLPINRQ